MTTTTDTSASTPAALAGIRVIEMGQLIAGPFCGKTLGEFGAEVIRSKRRARATRCATGGC